MSKEDEFDNAEQEKPQKQNPKKAFKVLGVGDNLDDPRMKLPGSTLAGLGEYKLAEQQNLLNNKKSRKITGIDSPDQQPKKLNRLQTRKITGIDSPDQQPKKLNRLQRLVKSLGIDKLLSKARGGNFLSRPSAIPNKKAPGQGQGMGK